MGGGLCVARPTLVQILFFQLPCPQSPTAILQARAQSALSLTGLCLLSSRGSLQEDE